MEESPASPAISAHDLRHHLSLLACDLTLTRERLRSREASVAEAYPALLERLEHGLGRARSLLTGGPVGLADRPAGADRRPMVQELWDRFRRAGRLPAGTLEILCEGPVLLPGSPERLHSLLLNLLENACAAAPEGPVRFTLDGGSLRIQNGGAVMAPELAAAINRGETPQPRGGRGQGLGLILRAAEELGLHLEVETGEGWTRFSLERGEAGAPRLLLIEDDADLRSMLAELLRRDGWRVDEESGAGGRVPTAGVYLAVLADLKLPGTGGDRLLAEWKRADPRLRTLMLTGESQAAARRFPGVDRVVIKPGLQELMSEMDSLRERRP